MHGKQKPRTHASFMPRYMWPHPVTSVPIQPLNKYLLSTYQVLSVAENKMNESPGFGVLYSSRDGNYKMERSRCRPSSTYDSSTYNGASSQFFNRWVCALIFPQLAISGTVLWILNSHNHQGAPPSQGEMTCGLQHAVSQAVLAHKGILIP